jgi:hypothetical protein
MSTSIHFTDGGVDVHGDRACAVDDCFRERNRIEIAMEQFGVTSASGNTFHEVMNDIYRQGEKNGHKPCGYYQT